jgi:hypothetical protein
MTPAEIAKALTKDQLAAPRNLPNTAEGWGASSETSGALTEMDLVRPIFTVFAGVFVDHTTLGRAVLAALDKGAAA